MSQSEGRKLDTRSLRKLEAKTAELRKPVNNGVFHKIAKMAAFVSQLGKKPPKQAEQPVRWKKFHEGRWVYADMLF